MQLFLLSWQEAICSIFRAVLSTPLKHSGDHFARTPLRATSGLSENIQGQPEFAMSSHSPLD